MKLKELEKGKAITAQLKQQQYLGPKIIKKMLSRFLLEKKMTKESLANSMYLNINELDRLLSNEDISTVTRLITRVNLPLIRLYCETNWSFWP